MKVISLRGTNNCGKTASLTILYYMLLANGYNKIQGCYKELSNGDFIDVLEKGEIIIGIVTQGDYVQTENSIKNHLEYLKSKGCNIAICACTSNNDKAEEQVKAYSNHLFIDKKKEKLKTMFINSNCKIALEIFRLI